MRGEERADLVHLRREEPGHDDDAVGGRRPREPRDDAPERAELEVRDHDPEWRIEAELVERRSLEAAAVLEVVQPRVLARRLERDLIHVQPERCRRAARRRHE